MQVFQTIPRQRPVTNLLDQIDSPADLNDCTIDQLKQLADELRAYLLYSVGRTGGHFGAGLGVIELTIALHKTLNTPHDRLVWDVGHQAYPHKILTGRREQLPTIRQKDGLAPFPKRTESPYDTLGVGHAGTAIGAALGMVIASQEKNEDRKVVAVVGDGAMTAGMSFEALNHVGELEANLLVVLNDNAMSISKNVGGLAKYTARILASKFYTTMREGSRKMLSHIPHAWELARRTEEHMKGMVVPGTLFEELGFNYIGPIDGHDLDALVRTLENIKQLKGPQFLHVVTQKGRGYMPAEQDPLLMHAISKIDPPSPKLAANNDTQQPTKVTLKYQDVFGQWLVDKANHDDRLVAITPAMCEGSGLNEFVKQHPERYFDVGIAEQHAVTLAAGLACEGLKPVVAIYSTFLQRAYDQLIHDVAIQNLAVLFAIDRAGLVGEDGPTHAGSFDLSFMRCIPNMTIMTPSVKTELDQALSFGFNHTGPVAIRYPRGPAHELTQQGEPIEYRMGKGYLLKRSTGQVAILVFGTLLKTALEVAQHLDVTICDMRFVKPLDAGLVEQMCATHQLIVTLEVNSIMGGAGSAVNEHIQAKGLANSVLNLGLPDQYIDHASQADMMKQCGLDREGIYQSIIQRLAILAIPVASSVA